MKNSSNPNIIICGLLVAFAIGISSCAHKQNTVKEEAPVHQLGTEAKYFYLEGLKQQNSNHISAAFDLYSLCQEIDPESADTYYQMSVFQVALGNDSIAQSYLEKAININPKNVAYHELLAKILINQTRYEEAIDVYERLLASSHSRTDILAVLLQLYEQQEDYKQMLHTIERIEEIEGTSEDFTLAKMQVYQMQGDKEAAYNSLCQLVKEHPNDVNFKVMLGNWLQKNSREEEALEIFLAAQKDDPSNESVELSLYDHYRADGQDSLAIVYRDRILMNKYTSISTKRTMIQQVIADNDSHGGDSTQVIALFNRMIENDPQNVPLRYLHVSYMLMKNMPDEDIEKGYAQIIDIEPDDSGARIQLLLRYWKKENWDAIIDLCLPATEYNTDNVNFCYFLGLAYFQKNNYEKAIEALKQGETRINDSSEKGLTSELYSLLGDILHLEGKDDEAFEAFENSLKWDADNISCLNNYAYYLSINNGDLKKAEQMSYKTIKAEPENATYLDTYAWILYLEERYIEAQTYIDKALVHMNKEMNNSTIFEHAGDIHLACDDKNKAIEYWKEALEGSEDSSELNKKIRKYEK